MKIIFFNREIESGGVSRVIVTWSNFFINKKIDTSIVIDFKTEPFFHIDEKVKCYYLIDYKSRNNIFKYFFKIYKFLLENNSKEIIMVFNKYYYTKYILLFKLFGKMRKVYFTHGGKQDFIDFYSLTKLLMLVFTYDEFIVLHDTQIEYRESKFITRKKLKYFIYKKMIKNKMYIIPNPIAVRTRQDKIKKLNHTFLTIGRLEYIKGFDLLLEAWSRFRKIENDWKLIIVGAGELLEDLKKKAQIYKLTDSLEIIGETKNIEEFYEKSDVLIVPSRREGLPLVIIEAMSYGLPIISFRTDGAKFLIQDKVNGLVAKDINPQSLCTSMLEIVRNPKDIHRMGTNSLELSRNFQIEKVFKSWNYLFSKIDQDSKFTIL